MLNCSLGGSRCSLDLKFSIEHKDFIGYEIEIVELSEEKNVRDDKHEKPIQFIINSKNSDSEQKSTNDKKYDKEQEFPSMVNLTTFTDLLTRVRQHHQHKSKESFDRRGRKRIKVKEAGFGRSGVGRGDMNQTDIQSKGKEEKLSVAAGFSMRYLSC